MVSKVDLPFYIPLPTKKENFNVPIPLHISWGGGLFCFLSYSHSCRFEVVSGCGFDLHFLNDVKHLFLCSLAISCLF
jgi:hypothetical protein